MKPVSCEVNMGSRICGLLLDWSHERDEVVGVESSMIMGLPLDEV